ncbi:hypothetical protein BMS3Abin03_00141 [bacterium BMS3Abin03]|nr:hypothetical protein BMS3Abin03_00141 [bacterium BMS3Abin03]
MKSINVKLDVALIKESNFYIAYAPALELTAYGKSIKEAKKNFEEVVAIFFEEVTSNDKLFDVLLELGWTLKKLPEPKFTPPHVKRRLSQRVNPPNSQLIGTSSQQVSIPVL